MAYNDDLDLISFSNAILKFIDGELDLDYFNGVKHIDYLDNKIMEFGSDDVEYIEDGDFEDIRELLSIVFDLLINGINVCVVSEELSDNDLYFLDTAYGLLLNAIDFSSLQGWCPVGLFAVRSNSLKELIDRDLLLMEFISGSQDILTFINQFTDVMELENGYLSLLQFVPVRFIQLESEMESGEIFAHQTLINYDLGLGGILGFIQLEVAAKLVFGGVRNLFTEEDYDTFFDYYRMMRYDAEDYINAFTELTDVFDDGFLSDVKEVIKYSIFYLEDEDEFEEGT